MSSEELDTRLAAIIPAHELNSWEEEELEEVLGGLDREVRETVLAQIEVIWPVSHSLCFAVLESLPEVLACLDPGQIAGWVKEVLAVYEARGLRSARRFMANVEGNYLCRIRGEAGCSFGEIEPRFLPYIRGLSGRDLKLIPGKAASCTSWTIRLPSRVGVFRDRSRDLLVYKLIISCQWALLAGDLYAEKHEDRVFLAEIAEKRGRSPAKTEIFLEAFFSLFDQPGEVAQRYFHLQLVRGVLRLHRELPGLMNDVRPLVPSLRRNWRESIIGRDRGGPVEFLFDLLADGEKACPPPSLAPHWPAFLSAELPLKDLCLLAAEPGSDFRKQPLDFSSEATPLFAGVFDPQAAHQDRLRRREELKKTFIGALAAFLPLQQTNHPTGVESDQGAEGVEQSANISDDGANVTARLPGESDETQEEDGPRHFICLDDENLDLPEELLQMGREIEDDLGGIPGFYIASARQMAGHAGTDGINLPAAENGGQLTGELLYDEWDYRRSGFRRNWCSVRLKEVAPAGGSFIDSTLKKHRGLIIQLRRQFETLRSYQRFAYRQRDGDDIDLDSVTEAMSDLRAGRAPSERLYVRLLRQERDTAALFLVDMSSSTEGWVGTALKESLLLMCEALEALGDDYAILGFSGMRRSRCEIYQVKDFGESYDSGIQARIAGIAPKDYTRMGPAIRHCREYLSSIEARLRLLIILTDGKPEDYDDYKGDYAIEDTRHALIEAKNEGIHPFCITIDRQAHAYMSHMFGEINYVFIDDVKKLPGRVPDLYRILTY